MRNRRLIRGALAVSLMLAMHVFAGPAAAQAESKAAARRTDSEVEEQWRSLFKQATVAFEERRFADAKAHLLNAGAIKLTPKILANLAQVEIQLGEHRAAATHAAEALAALGNNPGIEEDLATASKQLGKLLVRVNVEGAKIIVDQVEVGLSPLLRPVYLDPGAHSIQASKSGYATATRAYVAEKASEQSFDIELSPIAPGPTGTAAATDAASSHGVAWDASRAGAPPDSNATKPNTFVAVAGGVVALSGLVTGIYLNAKANSEANAADGLNATLGRDGCSHPSAHRIAPCNALMEHRESHDRSRNWSSIGFVVGGAAMVGTAMYWLWPRGTAIHGSTALARLHVQVDGVIAPGESWMGLAAQF